MTFWRMLLGNLRFHARANGASLLGCAVGAAILTGALLVGDSMRQSLRELTLERLGAIDQAVVGARFVRQDLPARLRSGPDASAFSNVAGAILIRGSVAGADADGGVHANLIGTTPEFWRLFPNAGDPDVLARQVIVNETLARSLGEDANLAGKNVIVRVEKASPIPREQLLGRRDETLRPLRLTVDRVIPSSGAGRFTLEATQALPRNIFVPIERLATTIDQDGRMNALLVQGASDVMATNADALEASLAGTMSLDDYGLSVHVDKERGYAWMESRRLTLEDGVVDAALKTSKELGGRSQPILTMLANTIASAGKEIPYSIAVALGSAPPPLGPLPTDPPDNYPGAGEILLNAWSADRLGAKVGDAVRLDYYVVGPRGGLDVASHEFRLAGVVAMEGLAIDRHYAPEYPGITDAEAMGDWDPPFPIDTKRVRPDDEAYWKKYRTAPKAFVSLDDGQRIWGTRFGKTTSVRLAAPAGEPIEAFADRFSKALRERLTPALVGWSAQPVKSLDLDASSGSTPFDVLFLMFSFFLIISAALLVGLLFRLSVERRASEWGLLLAVGVGPKRTRRLALAEGVLLAAIGSAIGLVGAVVYAKALLAGLTSWWRDAVGTPYIDYHWSVRSFAIGWALAVGIAAVAQSWAARRLVDAPAPRLLSPGFTFAFGSRRRGFWRWVNLASIAVGVVILAVSPSAQVGAFFGGGALLLIGGLGFLADFLHGERATTIVRGRGALALARLGIRNSRRYPARSVLTAGLIAFATYVVVAVTMFRHGADREEPRRDSGDGGYALVVETATPLLRNLADPNVRADLGFDPASDADFASATIEQFRVRPGDDASCLNIYQPRRPTLLGVPKTFVERGGFVFAGSLAETPEERENPWRLLDRRFDDGAIPAIGDQNTLDYILKVGRGADLVVPSETGEPVKLRIVGGLVGSIFQGELLIAEDRFLERFPDAPGFRYALVAAPAAVAPALAKRLRADLADYGVEVETTGDRLTTFRAVENAYIAAFQTLGGLGLLLGTLGLTAVMLRNVFERRTELALLRALGFADRGLAWLVLAENVFLLIAGQALGVICALAALAPHLAESASPAAIATLVALLGCVLGVGLASGAVAVAAALRAPLIPALRAE